MQALQFKCCAGFRGHLQNRSDGGGVVGCKLRVDRIGRVQQRFGTGQIRHIGVVFVGENGVMRHAHLLGAFNFAVPVSTFDQAAHQLDFVLFSQCGHMLDQLQSAGLVGLHG